MQRYCILGVIKLNEKKNIYITAVIKLLWQIIGLDLAKLVGYRSPKALQACLDANDHHKAMQFIEILLFGTCLWKEIIFSFINYTNVYNLKYIYTFYVVLIHRRWTVISLHVLLLRTGNGPFRERVFRLV